MFYSYFEMQLLINQLEKNNLETLTNNNFEKLSENNAPSLYNQGYVIKRQVNTSFKAQININKCLQKFFHIEFRRKRAKRWVMSWLIAQGYDFNEIAKHYIKDFKISKYDYEKAVKQQRISSGSIKEHGISKMLRKGN